MRRLTASRVGLALHCLAWLQDDMPCEDDAPVTKSTPAYLRKGLATHEANHRYVLAVGSEQHERDWCIDWAAVRDEFALAPAMLRDVKAMHRQIVDWLGPFSVIASERSYAIDPASGGVQEMAELERRDYSAAPPNWIGVTLDLLLDAGERVWIVELKTGRSGLEHPRDHMQVRTQALAVRALRKGVQATVLKVTPDSAIEVAEPHVYSRVELDAHARLLRDIAADMAKEEEPATPMPGEWCDKAFCPARGACPAYRAKGAA